MATDPKKRKETPSLKEQIDAIDRKLPRRMRKPQLIPNKNKSRLA